LIQAQRSSHFSFHDTREGYQFRVPGLMLSGSCKGFVKRNSAGSGTSLPEKTIVFKGYAAIEQQSGWGHSSCEH
jgi:hypothetical protein